MTFIEFLPFLGVFLGPFIYFVAGKTDRSFSESAGMALGIAIALVSLAAVGAYFFDLIVEATGTCSIEIPDIPDITIR